MDIVVLGSNSLFRAGLVSLLAALGFERVSEACSLDDLKKIPMQNAIDVVLFHLPHQVNSDVTDEMKEIMFHLSNVKVVFLSDQLDVDLMGECFAAGASGYLLQNLSRVALQTSLTLVCAGEKVFPSELASIIAELSSQQRGSTYWKSEDLKLSDRELEILRSLASGHPNKVIAAKLDIAESTVKVHLKRILEKTHSFNRTQAALWAVRHGIATACSQGVDKNMHDEPASSRDTVSGMPERRSC